MNSESRLPKNSDGSSRQLWKGLGWLLLGLALWVFWILVLRLDPEHTRQAGLAPYPDAVEYVDGAVNILAGKGFGIHLAGEVYPSRYPGSQR